MNERFLTFSFSNVMPACILYSSVFADRTRLCYSVASVSLYVCRPYGMYCGKTVRPRAIVIIDSL